MGLTLFCRHSDHIAHLEAEIAWLRTQMVHERQRAERAVDQILSTKARVAPIGVSPEAEVPRQETEIEQLLRNSEFVDAGRAE